MDIPEEEQRVLINAFQWIFWGGMAATLLYGATIVQTWLYMQHNQDRWSLRLFIYAIVLADTATEILIVMGVYEYFVKNFGNFTGFFGLAVPLAIELPITTVVTWVVQLGIIFQAYKIRWTPTSLLVRRSIVPTLAFCFLLSTAAMAFNLILTVVLATQRIHTGNPFAQKGLIYASSGLGQGLAAVADVLLTVVLCFALWTSLSSHMPSKGALNKLVLYCFNRGVLLAGCQIMFTMFYLLDEVSFKYNFFHLILSKLYVNTMLAIYNGRPALRSRARATSVFKPNSSGLRSDGRRSPVTGPTHSSIQFTKTSDTLSPATPHSLRIPHLPRPVVYPNPKEFAEWPPSSPSVQLQPIALPLRIQTDFAKENGPTAGYGE